MLNLKLLIGCYVHAWTIEFVLYPPVQTVKQMIKVCPAHETSFTVRQVSPLMLCNQATQSLSLVDPFGGF